MKHNPIIRVHQSEEGWWWACRLCYDYRARLWTQRDALDAGLAHIDEHTPTVQQSFGRLGWDMHCPTCDIGVRFYSREAAEDTARAHWNTHTGAQR